MLDLARMQRIRLSARPPGQLVLAEVLRTMYRLGGLRVRVIGLEHIPQHRPVILAMNHTDRYNYFPLQVRMHELGLRYLASWVKAKYYESSAMAGFMEKTANIPLASRGWVVTTEVRRHLGRPPTARVYRQLKDLADGLPVPAAERDPEVDAFLESAGHEDWPARVDARFGAFAGEAVRLTGAAFAAGLHVQIFPEGTRRIRLGRGHVGVAQIAQHFGVPVVPVGCSGSHRAFPGNSPYPSRATITYRVGAPVLLDDPAVAAFRVRAPFAPLTAAAGQAHGPAFRGFTDHVMARIAELVDPEHLPVTGEDEGEGGEQGAARFV